MTQGGEEGDTRDPTVIYLLDSGVSSGVAIIESSELNLTWSVEKLAPVKALIRLFLPARAMTRGVLPNERMAVRSAKARNILSEA